MTLENENFCSSEWKEAWNTSKLAAVRLGLLHEGIPRMLARLLDARSRVTYLCDNTTAQLDDYIHMTRFYLDVILRDTSHVLPVRQKALSVLIDKALCTEQIDDLMDDPIVARDFLRSFSFDQCGYNWIWHMVRGHRLKKVQVFLRHAFRGSVMQASKGVPWTYAEPQDFVASLAFVDAIAEIPRTYRLYAILPSEELLSKLYRFALTDDIVQAFHWKRDTDNQPVLWLEPPYAVDERPKSIEEAVGRGSRAALAYAELDAIRNTIRALQNRKATSTKTHAHG
jgi:hypothetical protein